MAFKNASRRLALRAKTPADFNFLYQLYASTRAHEMAMTDWPLDQKTAFLQMQFNAQSSFYAEQFQQANFDIIELDGNAIGRLYVDEREAEIRIIDIALLPDYTAQGIGGHYLQKLIDKAKSSQRKVSIHVEHNNPAMSLYKRLGFKHVRDEGVYWYMEWTPLSAQEKTAS